MLHMEQRMDKTGIQPLVIAICGVKNSGKTTCIEQLISILSKRGYKVAAIKHDGHEFQADVPGTDSYRMQQAGAFGTAVFSGTQLLVYKRTQTDIETMIKCFPESDLILVEGMKHEELLKYEIVRKGISDQPVSNPVGRLGIITDIPEQICAGELFDLNDLREVTEKLIERIERKRREED